jgi:thiol reductant ABC exporter CydD subunit
VKPLDSRLIARSRATRWYLVAAVLIAVASAALLVVAAFALSELIVRPFQQGEDLADVRAPLLLLAIALACRAALAWIAQVAAHRAAADVKSQLRHDLLTQVVRLGPSWLTTQSAGDLVTLATRGPDALDGYYAEFLPAFVTATFVPVGIGAVVLSQDLTAGLIILGTLPLVPLFGVLIGQNTQRVARKQWRALAVLGGHFLDVVEGLTTLTLYGRARAQTESIRRRAEQHRKATVATLRLTFLSSAALDFIATMSVALVAVSVGLRLVSGSLGLQTGLTVLILAPEAYRPLRDVAAQFHASAAGQEAAAEMYNVIDTPPSRQPSLSSACSVDPARASLRIDHLTVQYDRGTPALSDLNLVVHPGEYVGIVGASGIGKTTLLWVLLGFVTPTSGRVVLDASGVTVDLADIDIDLWRSRLAWVPQEPWLAPTSIADNVRLARPSASASDVERALKRANAAEFVAQLPDGILTRIGENGLGLSAGERQRIAIARVFLRDSPLVLLDEPTAHLDPESEAAVAAAVRQLAKTRTVIAVAHRPALLVDCDRVVDLAAVSQPVAA